MFKEIMATQAKITSVEAIELFRAALIVFTSQARPALEEVSSEMTRTRLWLENDQRRFWENERRSPEQKAGAGAAGIVHRPAFAISRSPRRCSKWPSIARNAPSAKPRKNSCG